ncbi:MAG TPA: hypothetical protein PKA41_14305, partial [Verrucomicrobiota bacterium]|nr:hypothetical protein [Verrucomicrobiota bacterium]
MRIHPSLSTNHKPSEHQDRVIAAATARPLLAAGLIIFILAATRSSADDGKWVTTWGTAPQLTEPNNLPPVPLAHSTLRQFVRPSIGGKHLRVQFSNAYGTNSVAINAARIALAPASASGGNGDIHTATDTPLTFRGAPGVVIPRGETIYSDPIEFNLPPLTNVAISTYFGDISATTINGHPGSRTTSFIQPGDTLSAASMPSASKTRHWYILTAIDVLASPSSRAVVVL